MTSEISDKTNIVLIGMPGCGKSTTGIKLAKKLNRPFFDTDTLIKEQTGKAPSQIIQEQGEESFRQIESQICANISEKTGVVIATGGGSILRQENVTKLKQNGLLFFLDRNIKNIKPTGNRPLSDTQNKLQELYKIRLPLYEQAADFHIKTDENLLHTIDSIISILEGAAK